eukprot:TRINITY_DN2239_c0_g1_i1.p1 TRINITY_DN2239_c0_g1~~TRINITY_DN2239_c0_g1_i1.p1  ORF type:complete len:290 (+),score=48.77 TRINITY_DN2239_c0_g1_i1:56-925(+)
MKRFSALFSGSDKSDSDNESINSEHDVVNKRASVKSDKEAGKTVEVVKKIETVIKEKEYSERQSLEIARKFTSTEFYEAGCDQQGGCVVSVSRESVPRRSGSGPLVGRAISVMYRSNSANDVEPQYWVDFIQYLRTIPGPKVLIPSDITKGDGTRPTTSLLNPQMASYLQTIGVMGVNTDSSISHTSALDRMNFITFSDCLCVRGGPTYATPLKWSAAIKTGQHTVDSPVVHCDDSGLVAVQSRHVPAIAQSLLQPTLEDPVCCDIIARGSVEVPKPPADDEMSGDDDK